MELKPIKYKKAYETIIADKITKWLWDNIFKECLDILKEQTVFNDDSIIRQALQKGLIFYQDNAFYSKSGRFSSKLSQELKKLGAKYSKYRNAFIIDKAKLSTEILWAIDTLKAQASARALLIQGFLTKQLGELGKEEKELVFDTAVETIMKDLQDRVYKNAQEKKIELISPKLTDFRANEIAKNYTENLNFWIKNWTDERIIKMRSAVGQMAIDGKSVQDIADYIEKEFNISKRHAKFLARNESAMATTSYLSAKYQEEGIKSFRWIVNLDNRERPWHRTLGTVGADGKGNIYRFDDPPIINEKTGQKGLPGYDYNCRCNLVPILDKEWLENRKKIYKAQNSLTGKIKRCLKAITKKYQTA